MKTKFMMLSMCTVAAALLAACGTTPNTGSYDQRDDLHLRCTNALTDFKQADTTLSDRMNDAYGYAIFPNVVTAAVGVGGAHGNGEVYEHGMLVGHADVSQASIGAQLGGQKFSELILFENQASLDSFKLSTVEFDARASAIAASSGAGAAAKYDRGVIIFTQPQGGLMFQAAVGGQKFRYIDTRDRY